MNTRPAHPVVHLELHARDRAHACSLYAELCGWKSEVIELRDGTYAALELGAGLGGGVVECPAPRGVWLPYVEVPDVFAATARACGLGAAVLLEPREGPAGWRSVIAFPGAGELAFWQPKRPG